MSGLPTVTLGDSKAAVVGDDVVAPRIRQPTTRCAMALAMAYGPAVGLKLVDELVSPDPFTGGERDATRLPRPRASSAVQLGEV